MDSTTALFSGQVPTAIYDGLESLAVTSTMMVGQMLSDWTLDKMRLHLQMRKMNYSCRHPAVK